MNELITWLRAQLDTDEQTARLASGVVEMFIAPRQNGKTIVSAFLRINTPERALRQVQAHRAILDTYEMAVLEAEGDPHDETRSADESTLRWVVGQLASTYSDRDGYRAEWSE